MSNERDILEEKARDLRRRLSFTTELADEREGPPTPHPPAMPEHEKKAFSSFRAAVTESLAAGLGKTAADLTADARADLPKKDFAVPASKSNTGEKAYPIPDEQHARSALGFAKMHHDSADYAAVRAKVEQKYPNLLKKQAMLHAAAEVFASKEAAGLLGRLASSTGTHKAELAGLGVLAVPALDEAQAHARAGLAGDYNKAGVKKRTLLPHAAHSAAELGGLGILAAPSAAALLGHGH